MAHPWTTSTLTSPFRSWSHVARLQMWWVQSQSTNTQQNTQITFCYICCYCPMSQHLCLSQFPPLQTVKRPRKIQIPVTTRPSRAASHSNLLDHDPPRRTRSLLWRQRHPDQQSLPARSNSPDRNGYGNTLPLVSSGYKRLPKQDVPEKPLKTTLVKKKVTDGKISRKETLFHYRRKVHDNPHLLTVLKCWCRSGFLSSPSFCRVWIEAGSQIFIKHMTETGLASKEGTLQEGDLILKVIGWLIHLKP